MTADRTASGVIEVDSASHLVDRLGEIGGRLESDGYCVVRGWSTEAAVLSALAGHFGPIQRHVRSGEDGVVEVSPRAAATATKEIDVAQYTGTSREQLDVHSDGSFLDGFLRVDGELVRVKPPKLVLLQCVVQAEEGGANALVDGTRVLSDLVFDSPGHAKNLLSRGAVTFCRDEQLAIDFPVFEQIRGDRFVVRFRYDEMLYTQEWSAPAVAHLQENYFGNPDYKRWVRLEAGQILVLDNSRMLHGRDALGGGGNRLLRRLWINDQGTGTLSNARGATVHHRAFGPFEAYRPMPGTEAGSLATTLNLGIRPPAEVTEVISGL